MVDTTKWACVLRGHHIQSDWASRAMNLHKILYYAWTLFHGNYSDDLVGCSYGQLVIGSFIMTMHLCITSPAEFLAKDQITQVTQPPYSPDLVPCNFWLFPKLKSPLKRKRFHTINENQENTMGQSWWRLGELCEVPRCLPWRVLKCHCLMYNVSCILYLQ